MPMIELLATIADTIGLDGFAFVKAHLYRRCQ